jgi:hypothetical protein
MDFSVVFAASGTVYSLGWCWFHSLIYPLHFLLSSAEVESSWNVMAHVDAREEKWRGNKRMEWVTSKRHMTAEHRLARTIQTLHADVHSSPASSRLNWRPCQFKWTRPFRWKTKSGFCACAITFQMQSTSWLLNGEVVTWSSYTSL